MWNGSELGFITWMILGRKLSIFFRHYLILKVGSVLEDEILDIIPSLVTEEDNKMLTSPPILIWKKFKRWFVACRLIVLQVLMAFRVLFFRDIIKEDLFQLVTYFFAEGTIPRSINATFLLL